ncbi:Uncharacterised protein [Streptococcus pneumoniae]|nr:Uncharacterised protein [Streptococcus pneumoniae]VLN99028.1 Uncharacterised protein [Streptococcus pneumoniae]
MDLILKTQSISLCHREELIIVDVSDDSKFGVFYKRFRTLVDKITENMFVFIISVVFQIYCKTGKIIAIENFRLRLLKANLNYLSFYIIKKILKQFRCYLEKKLLLEELSIIAILLI